MSTYETSFSQAGKKKLGKTLEIYRKIAIAINSFPRGKNVSVKDLAEKANVHWNTAKKALLFLNSIAPLIPEFELETDLEFRIQKKPNALKAVEGIFESKEMRILTKMMLAEATEPRKAGKLKDILTPDERNGLTGLIERGYVNSINGNYYLSKRGQSVGSMGIRRIVELDIPLPWEQVKPPIQKSRIHAPSRLKSTKYHFPSPRTPRTIYSPSISPLSEKKKWTSYTS